jgi:hypothetical protein
MKTLRALLQEGDPVEREPALAPDDVDRMRRAVLTSAGPSRRPDWTMRVVLAAALSLIIGVSARLGPSTTQPRPAPRPIDGRDQTGSLAVLHGQRRQVQFATPGGTRIIWVFDSNFSVR